jgi:CRP/FNR family cyclic AMP-dependent transcriptional regulator
MASHLPSSPRHQERVEFFRRHPLFRELRTDVLERWAARAIRKSVSRNAVLFAKGDPGDALVGVLKGTVKISVVAHDGREALLNIIHEGEMFGEIALLDGQPRTADATAMSDCELFYIERADFLAILRSEPDVALKIIELLCARMRRSSEQVEDVMFLNAAARLAKAVLRLSADGAADGARARAKITQREISQIIGLSREMTNRHLREWERARLIELQRGAIVLIEPAALAKIASEGMDGDF